MPSSSSTRRSRARSTATPRGSSRPTTTCAAPPRRSARCSTTPASRARDAARPRRPCWRATRGTRRPTPRWPASRGSRVRDARCRSSSSATTRAADLERLPGVAARRAPGAPRTRSSSSTTRRPTAASQAARAVAASQVIALERNVGFAAANNVGIRATHGRAGPAAQQRHDRAARGDRRAGRRGCGEVPRGGVAGPRLVDAHGRPELSFGAMLDRRWPSGGARRLQRQIDGDVRGSRDWLRNETTPRALRRLGQRRLPAGPAARRGRRRAARRALFPVQRGRRLLRRAPDARAARSCSRRWPTITHLRGRSRASQPEASRQAYAAATSPSTRSTTRSGRRS